MCGQGRVLISWRRALSRLAYWCTLLELSTLSGGLQEWRAGEHELAVCPETEERPEADPDDVGDVIGEQRVQAECVSGNTQAGDRDNHGGEVERHEKRDLVGCWSLATMTEGPKPVAEPRHERPNARRDDPSCQRLVVERSDALPFAEDPYQVWAEHQDVVAAKVDDKRYDTDRAELDHLRDEAADRATGAVE